MAPPDLRATFEAQMNAANVDWRMIVYGGVEHAFTVPGANDYGMPACATIAARMSAPGARCLTCLERLSTGLPRPQKLGGSGFLWEIGASDQTLGETASHWKIGLKRQP